MMIRLIEYIDNKISQSKGTLAEVLLNVRDEVLSLMDSMESVRSENERLQHEVRRLEEVLKKHAILYPNNYKVQLEKLEAANTRLKAELEMYKATNQKSCVAVSPTHLSRNSNKWN